MSQRVSLYLSDEAVKNLSEIQAYLENLTGVKISRSSAMNTLLVRGTSLFLEDRANVSRVVAKYAPGPQVKKAMAIADEEAVRPFVPWQHDQDKDHGDTDEEAAE